MPSWPSTRRTPETELRYTAENATESHIKYAYRPEHPACDDDGNVTFVNMSWGEDFIATFLPGSPSVLEAFALAACEMNTTCPDTIPFTESTWLGLDDRDLFDQEIR